MNALILKPQGSVWMASAVTVLRHAGRHDVTASPYAGIEISRPVSRVLSGPACLKRYFGYGPYWYSV